LKIAWFCAWRLVQLVPVLIGITLIAFLLLRVMPGDPDHSFLMSKLHDNLAAGEGKPMPFNGAPLDAVTLNVVRAWIEAGAPREGRVPGDDGQPLGGTVTDSNEVNLPPPARGVQLQVTAPVVPPGKEQTTCHYFKLKSDVDFDVNRIQLAVSGGTAAPYTLLRLSASTVTTAGVTVKLPPTNARS
jgi:hypothetical protein